MLLMTVIAISGSNRLGTPVMGMSLWDVSPLCETGSLSEISEPNDNSDYLLGSNRMAETTPLKMEITMMAWVCVLVSAVCVVLWASE
jgi:hypothetical protein